MDAPSIDLQLKTALSAGDRRRAAGLLVEHYADDVFAVCRAMLRDRTLAEDLAQETFTRAIAALATFRGESSPRTWLLSIARNGCLDVLRSRRASPVDDFDHEPDAHLADAPAAIDLLVRRDDVERALAPLSETERALVVLHYGHGVGYAELADSFQLREGALRMRMSRAVDKMRSALAQSDALMAGSLASPALAPRAAASAAPQRAARPPLGERDVPSPEKKADPTTPPAAPGALASRARVASGGRAASAGIGSLGAAEPARSPLHEPVPDLLRARLSALAAAA